MDQRHAFSVVNGRTVYDGPETKLWRCPSCVCWMRWEAVQCTELMSVDQTEPGICDVKSGAGGTATDGTAYNTW